VEKQEQNNIFIFSNDLYSSFCENDKPKLELDFEDLVNYFI
jgi:hypothetical protein